MAFKIGSTRKEVIDGTYHGAGSQMVSALEEEQQHLLRELRMEVKIISRETIRPSSPTPSHLKKFKFSLFDQVSPCIYMPVILYYNYQPSNNNIKQVLAELKGALSKTLSHFYPFAGRIKDHVTIDCNDERVPFLQAQVDCHLSEFLKQPPINLLDRLVPCQVQGAVAANVFAQVAVQVNIFGCGGMAMGLCFLHKIMDAVTMAAFLKCWAALASGVLNGIDDKSILLNPSLNSASIFPPSDQIPRGSTLQKPRWLVENGKRIYRRFVFDSSSISALKAAATSLLVPNPTTVQVVSAFIWKSAVAASKAVMGSKQMITSRTPDASRFSNDPVGESSVSRHGDKDSGDESFIPSILSHTLNLRPRMVPPLPENLAGNVVWGSTAYLRAFTGEETEMRDLVGLIKDGIAKIDSGFVESLKGDFMSKAAEVMREFNSVEKLEWYTCSSWRKLGFNEVDFGWGKPVWVSPLMATQQLVFCDNIVCLIETRLGDGIEAWLFLGEEEMARLENDPEFVKFASFNPSV